MFQILEFTEAHVSSVTNRTETHGDDKVPAVSIGLEMTCANTILDQIDPTIRPALFKRSEDQEDLPGIEPSTPVLACHTFEIVKLTTAHDGWTLQVDDGIDDTTPMTFGSCKVDKLTVEPKQGGSIVLRFRIGTSDVDAASLGQLAMHNGQSIWITLTPPAKPVDAIDGSTEAFARDHPGAGSGQADLLDQEAGDAFAAAHRGPDDDEDGDSEGGQPDADRAPRTRGRRRGTAAEVS